MAGFSALGLAEVLDITPKTSKGGKAYKLITLGNREAFYQAEFFLSEHASLDGISKGSKVHVEYQIEKKGYESQVSVVGLSPAK